jgi:hypothetical protein
MRGDSDDLFKATLTEADDAVDFDRPWSPWSLVILTFFGGLVAGGGLLALNFRRLGTRGRVFTTLAVVGVVTVVMAAATAWTVTWGGIDPSDREARRVHRMVQKAIECAVAAAFAVQQRRRYRLFQTTGLEAGRLVVPALAAVGISIVVTTILVFGFMALFRL